LRSGFQRGGIPGLEGGLRGLYLFGLGFRGIVGGFGRRGVGLRGRRGGLGLGGLFGGRLFWVWWLEGGFFRSLWFGGLRFVGH
jgi:hypothetical protein